MQPIAPATLVSGIALAALIAAHAYTGAAAQTAPPANCSEGRTASGSCINESAASQARQSAIVFTQPHLSYTGPVAAANPDKRYDSIRDNWPILLRTEQRGTVPPPM